MMSLRHLGQTLKWEASDIALKHVCPFCSGQAKIRAELRDFGIYGESIQAFYACVKCEEEFTTTEIDEINITPLLKKKRGTRKVVEIIKSVLKLKLKNNGTRSNRQQS